MKNGQASPALGEARGLKNENLVVMTRPTILQILARFCGEVKDAKDISPFLDRIMEDLDRPGQDDAVIFEAGAPVGERLFLRDSKGGAND